MRAPRRATLPASKGYIISSRPSNNINRHDHQHYIITNHTGTIHLRATTSDCLSENSTTTPICIPMRGRLRPTLSIRRRSSIRPLSSR